MSISFQSLAVRSARRLRLRFSSPLALGAYATDWFALTCTNGFGGDPVIRAALMLTTDATALELALAIDLAPGGVYELAIATGLPAADASVTDATTETFTVAIAPQDPSESFSADDLSSLVYRVDVLHDGNVMVETADGDLATTSGPENVKGAVLRRMVSEGMPHSPDYGARARDSNDAPGVSLNRLRGRLQTQARLDPRVVSVTITTQADENDGTVILNGQAELQGGALVQFQQEPI